MSQPLHPLIYISNLVLLPASSSSSSSLPPSTSTSTSAHSTLHPLIPPLHKTLTTQAHPFLTYTFSPPQPQPPQPPALSTTPQKWSPTRFLQKHTKHKEAVRIHFLIPTQTQQQTQQQTIDEIATLKKNAHAKIMVTMLVADEKEMNESATIRKITGANIITMGADIGQWCLK